MLLRRLRPCIQIRAEQHGFRRGHSTVTQLTRVLRLLAAEYNRGRISLGVFLDIEKAFNRVWHSGLLYKLYEQTSIPLAMLRLVASFLEDRKFYVFVEDAESATRSIRAGVPQGSCLSPVLYAAYTNDIPTLAGRLQAWEDDVELALYADDSAYFTSSRRAHIATARMQGLLDLLPPWLDEWRMVVNVGKTTALLTCRLRNFPPPLTLYGQKITYQKAVTYRGCGIERTLRMTAHVDFVVRRARCARATFLPVLASKLPIKTKLRIYKMYIRSIITYAAPAWYALLSDPLRRRMQAQQNLTLRTIVGAGRYVRNDVIAADLKVETITDFVAPGRATFSKRTPLYSD
ncbi:unnamed protein product [Parnassius apollo]|uniref:(apollo) hypothetical protein n=1 Tax=Parnassius apollo TaxID=110799 RepID=A0A8S3X460_PARAO|nr:unnamed protein product [Parnassius apollo]